jgi:hypothetical protein
MGPGGMGGPLPGAQGFPPVGGATPDGVPMDQA